MDHKFLREYTIVSVSLILSVIVAVVLFSRLYTQTSAPMPKLSKPVYVIDPGHGGEDGGAVSVTGALESELNLQIAIRTNDLLNLLGYQTKLLRSSDRDLHTQGDTIAQRKRSDLRERVNIVNSTPNAVLISIHQNHFSDPRYSGLQVFYAPTEVSKELAQTIQAEYKKQLMPTSRRIAQTARNIYLMAHVTCTAVLVECGFLSNHSEAELLQTMQYQTKLSLVIISAITNLHIQ